MQPNFLRCMFDAMARSPVFSFDHSAHHQVGRKLLVEKPSVVPTHTVSTDQRMKILPFIGICFGYFMMLLDTTIVNVAGPAISHDLGGFRNKPIFLNCCLT